jgi:hypothetical protein
MPVSNDVLHPLFSYDSINPYYQTSQQLCQFFNRSQQAKSPEDKNTVKGVECDDFFIHILEDPFVSLLAKMNSTKVFDCMRFGFVEEVLSEILVSKIWSKLIKSKKIVDEMVAWLHWHFDYT